MGKEKQMIGKIEIRNFSTHKKQDIEFGPNVTTITGSSFLGKSTILRAIKFVCMNKPTGDKFINWDADKTSVRITIDNKKIIRRKGKGVNSYKLSGYKDPFTGFNVNVPQPIADLVNMSDINFQGQHDALFLLYESPPEVSRQLNAIINLEVIDRTLSNIASGIRKAKITIEITQKRFDNAATDMENLAYIVKLDKDLTDIEKLEKTQSQIAVGLTTIDDLIRTYIRHKAEQDNAAQRTTDGLTALEKGQIWLKIRGITDTLDNHVKTGIRADKVIQGIPPDIKPLDELETEWIEREEEKSLLEDLIDEIENSEDELCLRNEEFKNQLKELRKLERTIERCPLCGNKMMKKL